MAIQETKVYDASNNPVTFQGISAEAVSPSDETIFQSGILYIGSSSNQNVRVKTVSGDIVTFTNVASSFILPVKVIMLYDTGTTASDFVIIR